MATDYRYGISALDLKYKSFAVNDELLVRGHDGKIHYKREDGQVVSYDSIDYNKKTLIDDICEASMGSNIKASNNDFLTYHTIDISAKNDLLSDSEKDLGLNTEFRVSKKESCLFFRVRGTDVTNSVISYIETMYNMKSSVQKDTVSLTFAIREIGTGVVRDMTIGGEYNKMIIVPIVPSSEDVKGYNVKLKSIAYPMFKEGYDSFTDEQKERLHDLNEGNSKFESSIIDIAAYTDDISDPNIYNSEDGVSLKLILTINQVNDIMSSSESIIISEEKPTHSCLWGKVL